MIRSERGQFFWSLLTDLGSLENTLMYIANAKVSFFNFKARDLQRKARLTLKLLKSQRLMRMGLDSEGLRLFWTVTPDNWEPSDWDSWAVRPNACEEWLK